MEVMTLVAKVDEIVTPTVESLGCELVEIEYLNEGNSWVLRLYIDAPPQGVTVGDCERVSRAVSALLDVEDIIPQHYNLEVSSPGTPRPIRKERDFVRFTGTPAKIRTIAKIDGRRNFSGVIQGVQEGCVQLEREGEVVEIPITEIFKARLVETPIRGGK